LKHIRGHDSRAGSRIVVRYAAPRSIGVRRFLKYFPFGKTARLDLVGEAFNLFNHTNVTQINPVFGIGVLAQSCLLQPLAGAGRRQIQFSLDFEF
jgi:hypothetical protein